MRRLQRARLHRHAVERSAEAAAPMHDFVAPHGQQQLDRFFETRARFGRVDAEVAVRTAQDAASSDDQGAPAGQHVQRGVVLGGAHRVERAEQRDAGAEPDAPGALGDRRQHDGR